MVIGKKTHQAAASITKYDFGQLGVPIACSFFKVAFSSLIILEPSLGIRKEECVCMTVCTRGGGIATSVNWCGPEEEGRTGVDLGNDRCWKVQRAISFRHFPPPQLRYPPLQFFM